MPRFTLVVLAALVSCGGETTESDDAGSSTTTTTTTPPVMMGNQDDCLEDGGLDPAGEYFAQAIPDSVCECIAATDDASYAPSTTKLAATIPDPDPRIGDPAYAMWRDEIKKTRCGCCHDTVVLGPGVPYWDLAFTPFWVDSAVDDVLRAMGDPLDKPGLTLPLGDQLPDFQLFVEAEIAWRASL
jgi:hypothetical protein